VSKADIHVAENSIVAKAPADIAYGWVANGARWAQIFSQVVHTAVTPLADGQDHFEVWQLRPGEDKVYHWKLRRGADKANLRIAFSAAAEISPFAAFDAVWSFEPLGDDSCRITLRHEYGLRGDARASASEVGTELGKHADRQLEELKNAAERAEDLEHLIVDFEDPLFVCGEVEDAWAILYECDKWPQRLSHVAKLDLVETTPGIQFFDMDTTTPDGRAHTTRSVRVCLPYDLIVYKQVKTPPLLEAHTGHWRFTPTTEGLIVAARHTVTIDPTRLSLLGPDTTVHDARRYLRRVLSANSMTNLKLAKNYAEERAGF
jgi:Polyketide cyclase / dehydrase and lipid transport.